MHKPLGANHSTGDIGHTGTYCQPSPWEAEAGNRRETETALAQQMMECSGKCGLCCSNSQLVRDVSPTKTPSPTQIPGPHPQLQLPKSAWSSWNLKAIFFSSQICAPKFTILVNSVHPVNPFTDFSLDFSFISYIFIASNPVVLNLPNAVTL